MIVDSKFEEGPPQEDGRRFVRELHTDDTGATFVYEWLGDQDANDVLLERVSQLNELLQRKLTAKTVVNGTKLPLTKYEFRQLFTLEERVRIDEFETFFESRQDIDESTKSFIRSGFKDFNAAQEVTVPFTSAVTAMLDIFVNLGLITSVRKLEIMGVGNG